MTLAPCEECKPLLLVPQGPWPSVPQSGLVLSVQVHEAKAGSRRHHVIASQAASAQLPAGAKSAAAKADARETSAWQPCPGSQAAAASHPLPCCCRRRQGTGGNGGNVSRDTPSRGRPAPSSGCSRP